MAVVRCNERKVFPSYLKSAHVSWHFESLDFRVNERKLSGYLAHFRPPPPDKVVPHYHQGVELLYLIEGKLEMKIGVETFQLSAGDSIYFDSVQKHTYRSLVKTPCTAIVVTAGAPLIKPNSAGCRARLPDRPVYSCAIGKGFVGWGAIDLFA